MNGSNDMPGDLQQAGLLRSLQAVERYVEDSGYRGYDPGDGLTSFLRPLTFGNILAERILTQAVWKAPFNVRPLVGIKPMDSTKGRGFMAWGYLLRYKAEGRPEHLHKALQCLDWLDSHREPGHAGHCWGNHFDFTTRTGRMVAHTPTIVWSGLIGQAFVEAAEQTREQRWLDVADSICKWILTIPREETGDGCCLSYTARSQSSVHNSNLLGAAMLAKTGKLTGNAQYLDLARRAVAYSCNRQMEDGAWWYGEREVHHWIDSFHTAYNLDSIRRYVDASGDETFREALMKGYAYYKRTFFDADGRPGYYHNRVHPVDIQCASQAVDTFAYFSDLDPDALAMSVRVALWTITNMQDRSGYFYYRKYPVMTARTPYFHWGQSTSYKALSHLLLRIKMKGGTSQ